MAIKNVKIRKVEATDTVLEEKELQLQYQDIYIVISNINSKIHVLRSLEIENIVCFKHNKIPVNEVKDILTLIDHLPSRKQFYSHAQPVNTTDMVVRRRRRGHE